MNKSKQNPVAKFNVKLSAMLISAAIGMSGCISSSGIQHDQALRDPTTLGAQAKFDAWPAEQWWKSLNDPELDRLIEQALKENPNITQAAKRMEKAAAYVTTAKSALSPQLSGDAYFQRQRLSENSYYPPPFGGAYENIVNGQLNASWDIDFWDKNRSLLQSALSQTEAAKAEESAARLMVSTAVAQSYYQLARQVEQVRLSEQALKQREQEFNLIKQRIQAGLDTNVELQQGRGNMSTARVDVGTATEAANLTRNALAALTASEPKTLASLQPLLPTFEAQALPDDIPVDIISRRPDLAAAKARVDAASADTASAKAQFYPNVSLSAFIGLSSFGLSNFFKLGSTIAGVGPAIHLPIFDADNLRANLRSKNADLDISIASYNQVLLTAIHDIADQMTSIKAVRLQKDDQQIALNSAESAYKLATIRYQAGLTTLLTVLNAEDTLLRERSRMVNLHAREIDLNIALIKSLGGGFANTPPAETGKPS
ncbi:MAG TPA: efflux transporter outer membrane subunit [Methylophilaceae bacterium]